MNMQCDVEPLSVLNGCVICVSGFSPEYRKILKGMIEFLGGVYMEDMDFKTVTFLISCNTMSEKTKHAKHWGVPVLHQQWIFDCAYEQRFVSVNDYIIQCKMPTVIVNRNYLNFGYFNQFPK